MQGLDYRMDLVKSCSILPPLKITRKFIKFVHRRGIVWTVDSSKLKRSVDMRNSGKNGLKIANASPNGTGPGVRRSKRPLLA